MARTPLPRFRADVSLVLEVAAVDEEAAAVELEQLAELIRLRAATTVRNAGGRTARVVDQSAYVGEPSAV